MLLCCLKKPAPDTRVHVFMPHSAHQVLSMSMNGLTCSALGLMSPAGLNTKLTRSPQGVLVTCGRRHARACLVFAVNSRQGQPLKEASPPSPPLLCVRLLRWGSVPAAAAASPLTRL